MKTPAPLPAGEFAYSIGIGGKKPHGFTRRIVGDVVVQFWTCAQDGDHCISAIIGTVPPTAREIECMAGGIMLTDRLRDWMEQNPELVSKRRAEAADYERRELISRVTQGRASSTGGRSAKPAARRSRG